MINWVIEADAVHIVVGGATQGIPNGFRIIIKMCIEGDFVAGEDIVLTLRTNGAANGDNTQEGVYFKSIELFPSIDFDQAIIYLKRFNKKILYAKVGFLLSYFEKRWSFPENYKKVIKAHFGTRINYLSDKREEAKLDKEWKLMIPVRLKSLLEEY